MSDVMNLLENQFIIKILNHFFSCTRGKDIILYYIIFIVFVYNIHRVETVRFLVKCSGEYNDIIIYVLALAAAVAATTVVVAAAAAGR